MAGLPWMPEVLPEATNNMRIRVEAQLQHPSLAPNTETTHMGLLRQPTNSARQVAV